MIKALGMRTFNTARSRPAIVESATFAGLVAAPGYIGRNVPRFR